MWEIIRKIAQTFVLCGSLGLALYVVLMAAIHNQLLGPALPVALAAVCCVVGLAMIGRDLKSALETGKSNDRFWPVSRARQPFAFWVSVTLKAASVISLAALAVHLLVLMVSGPSEGPILDLN